MTDLVTVIVFARKGKCGEIIILAKDVRLWPLPYKATVFDLRTRHMSLGTP